LLDPNDATPGRLRPFQRLARHSQTVAYFLNFVSHNRREHGLNTLFSLLAICVDL
jgi:hypothetical protein